MTELTRAEQRRHSGDVASFPEYEPYTYTEEEADDG
jgi:hypothetical protein